MGEYFTTSDGARVYGTVAVSKRVKPRRAEIKSHVKPISKSLVLAILISLFLICSPALAVYFWYGGVDNDWNNGDNWGTGVAPPNPVNGSLAFPSQDVGDRIVTGADVAYTGVAGISFNNASGGFSIAGTGSFSLGSGSSVTGDADFTHNFNTIDFVSNGPGGIIFDGTDSYTVGGVVSGAGITKQGAGTLTLSGTNTYTGGTTLNAGTIILGANAALGTGGLTLGGAAALQSNNDARSVSNAIATGGNALTVSGASNLTLSGIISGTGTLTTDMTVDADTLTLSGTNTYSGGTTLTKGTIILGANAALGTGALTLGGDGSLQSNNDARSVSNAIDLATNTLTFSGANNATLSGIISSTGGGGILSKSGAGTLTLNGDNTYTGGTTINAGTLTLGAAERLADTGAVTLADVAGANLVLGGAETIGSLAGGGTTGGNVNLGGFGLTVGDATSTTYAGVISGGAGTLTKQGAGTLTLSGVNTYAGLTTLSAGGLILTGQVGGALTVTAGTLSGTGTIAGTTTLNGGTFSPGASIGTTTIGGNYVQNAGSTLEVEVSKTGGCDFLDVTGIATLDAGSTISVLDISPAGNIILTGDTFNIIEADGGITDNGPTITDNSAVLSFTGSVSGNFYQLAASRQAFASAVGLGGGGPLAAIDSDMANASGDYITLINALTALNSNELSNAGEQLDPLPHASATTVSLRTTQQMAGNLVNYLSARRSGIERTMMFDAQTRERQLLIADASSDPRTLAHVINENKRIEKMQQDESDSQIKGFFRPFGVFYNHDSTSGMIGFNAKAVGTQFGFDKSFGPNLILGIGGGYSHSFINFKERNGEGDVDSFRVGPYASYFKNNFFVDTAVSFGYHKNKNERDIRFGTINRTANSDYDAYDLSVYAGTGYDFHIEDWTATPTASIQYISYRNESFRETGAGAAGLSVNAATSESLRSKLGVKLSTLTELYGTKIVPELFVGWAHEFLDDENIRARFVEGAAKFTTEVDDEWDDSVYFGAGISALLRKDTSVFVRYEGEHSSGNSINSLNVGITVLF
jgi:fibronectin-binding autotransporter adhesin